MFFDLIIAWSISETLNFHNFPILCAGKVLDSIIRYIVSFETPRYLAISVTDNHRSLSPFSLDFVFIS